ncbi:MAG: zinc ribbon domain-containing protein [Clostridia bacterium]|nr:zinc ribbon domain-containing protein [Clostridia bacterium]MBR2613637.1 zinc ribbon domain-containing protein [Clostridia bacterium]
MYCKYCGAELLEGQTFCADCGNQVGKLFKEEKPKKAGLDVGMLVWSILGMYFCGAFSIPALVMTILASVGTVEESKIRLNIARRFNTVSMIFGAVMNALVCLYILFYVVFIMMMLGMA